MHTVNLKTVFEKMCRSRYFEQGVIARGASLKAPVYLSMGQESIAATVSELYPEAKVFCQHRSHAWYLSYGGDPAALRDEILGLPTGCCGGKGGSSDVQCDQLVPHNGFLGENVPIAVGYAYATREPVVAVCGDGALEEDYVLASLGFAATHSLPVFFVIEDNGLAILTKIPERRTWTAIGAARGFGLMAQSSSDNPEAIEEALVLTPRVPRQLPFLLNVRTCRHRWHAGVAADGPPECDRLAVIREHLGDTADAIEKKVRLEMEALWQSA